MSIVDRHVSLRKTSRMLCANVIYPIKYIFWTQYFISITAQDAGGYKFTINGTNVCNEATYEQPYTYHVAIKSGNCCIPSLQLRDNSECIRFNKKEFSPSLIFMFIKFLKL